ncbi:hypothetical protein Tco_0086223 [Tanacetum coccineum]
MERCINILLGPAMDGPSWAFHGLFLTRPYLGGESTESDDTMNDDTLVGVASAVQEGVTPSVVDMTIDMGKQNSLDDTTILESFPPLSTPVTTTAVNVRTLFTPGGNGIDVVVLVDSIRAISERFDNTAYGFFLGKKVAYPVVANYVTSTWGKYGLIHSMFSSSTGLFSFQFSSMDGLDAMLENGLWSSYARVMIELRADMELKDNIVVAMPKITRESHYTCNVCVEYESKPPRCSSCTIFGHIHEECPKNTGFKPYKKYRPVLKKSTASSSDNKKKGAEPTIEFGTNEGTTNLVNNRATSSGSSFMNADNSSSGTTLIIEKIGKFEDLLTSGQAILVDKAGNPLKKIVFPGEYDSEGEVALVDNDMARSMAYERVGFGTQSLLEQWKDSYGNGDYDDDPYDDDMYDGQDLSHELHDICDNLDIRV